MSLFSDIEWTEATWNPVTGCTQISPGCDNCYAKTFAERFRGVKGHPYEQGFDVKLWPERLSLPLAWREKRKIFVNSMSDLYHEKVPKEFVLRVFETMNAASWHTFQILTKRAKRLQDLGPELPWAPNIWQDVSVESKAFTWRIDALRKVPAKVRFLSLEPLLGPLPDLDLAGIHWVIVGGESGHHPRPMKASWVRQIRAQCRRADVPLFFKQHGHIRNNPNPSDPTAKENGGTSKGGAMLDGRLWRQFPGESRALLTARRASTGDGAVPRSRRASASA